MSSPTNLNPLVCGTAPATPAAAAALCCCCPSSGFGRAYFKVAPSLFAHEDAAYILAYSVIMLNTDRHNNQVSQPGFGGV